MAREILEPYCPRCDKELVELCSEPGIYCCVNEFCDNTKYYAWLCAGDWKSVYGSCGSADLGKVAKDE